MPLGGSTALAEAVTTSGGYAGAVQVVVTLPVLGALDVTAVVSALDYEESDTSSYPDDLTDMSGIENVAGSVTLAGSLLVNGALVSVTRLFNPNDAASPIYRQALSGSPIVVSLGAQGAPLVDRSGYLASPPQVSQADGTVVLNWSDVPPGWDNLPEIAAVLTEAPYNAGLTSEFVIDRIARTASGGAVSSWPAVGANDVLAVGLRTSLTPEVGSLAVGSGSPLTVIPPPGFAEGLYGSGLATSSDAAVPWFLSSTLGANITIKCFVSGNAPPPVVLGQIGNDTVWLQYTPSAVTVYIGFRSGSWVSTAGLTAVTWTVASTPGQFLGCHVNWPIGSTTADVTFRLGSTTHTVTGVTVSNRTDRMNLAWLPTPTTSTGVTEALRVTSDTAPTWDDAFVPLARLDPSLNALQAVPAIDAGTDAYSELQTVAEAEGGWIGFRNGVLTFLNRVTIASQAPTRTVKASVSLVELQDATGGVAAYDDLTIDYTEYTWADPAVVFTPVKKWKVPARSTQTWYHTFTDGTTVGAVDQSIGYATTDTSAASIGTVNSLMRGSLDVNGLNEMPDTSKLTGTVVAVSPSRIKITVTNSSGRDVWLVSPANYTGIDVGTPALWINGVAVTPDSPTTVHPTTAVSSKSTYQAPSNGYRQDRASALAYAADLLAQLSTPRVSYGSVSVIADPSVTVPDRITLDVPVDGGAEPLDVLVWGSSFTASFEAGSESWDHTLDVRAVAGPGQLVWDQSSWDAGSVFY